MIVYLIPACPAARLKIEDFYVNTKIIFTQLPFPAIFPGLIFAPRKKEGCCYK
jgi:hypothetical protein